MGNRALICVDVQNDFLPGGALGVSDGDAVIRPLIDAMNDVDIIVLTADWHPKNHMSFSNSPEYVDGSWPAHCVQGTKGALINEEILYAATDTGKRVLVIHKGTDPKIEAYSGFDGHVVELFNVSDFEKSILMGESLGRALNALNVNDIKVGGLALDYCVKATALDIPRSWRAEVLLEATRPVAYLSGANAVAELVEKRVRTVA